MRLLLPVLPLLLLASASPLPCFTTWDEPWHEAVVANAYSFVKLQVIDRDKDRKMVTAKVLDRIVGGAVPDQLAIDSYSMLDALTWSSPDDEIGFRLRKDNVYYVFLAKPEKGDKFAIATPSAGWAHAEGGKVIATYRHSYHLSQVPEALYRETQKAIFQSLHGGKHDDKAMQKLLREWLRKPPGELTDDTDESQTFFCQHAALECFYYFGKPEDVELLEPFLRAESSHHQISAVRALSRIDTPAARARLFAFLTEDREGFAKVMAVWGLRRLDAREFLERLVAFIPNAATEKTGFGGSIMDPRVGTRFPASVKAAAEELVARWRPAEPTGGKK